MWAVLAPTSPVFRARISSIARRSLADLFADSASERFEPISTAEGNRTLVKIQQLKNHSLHAETAKEKHLCFATETNGASVQKMDGFEIVSPLSRAWQPR